MSAIAARRYFVYWIRAQNRHYIGATVSPRRRLRQHNGQIQGGAARTRNRGPWSFECVVHGFRTWQEALQFEWAFKYFSKRCRSVESRSAALTALMQRERWTSNAPPALEVPLVVERRPDTYGHPPTDYNPLASQPRKVPRQTVRRRGWKKKLRGVQ